MRSRDLDGFSAWTTWGRSTVNGAPTRAGVYAFRLTIDLPRLKDSSDIIYIGSAGEGKATVQSRLLQHLNEREDEIDIGHRLGRVLRETTYSGIEVAWQVFESAEEARWNEAALLLRHEGDHIELPPLNREVPMRELFVSLRRSGVAPMQIPILLKQLPALAAKSADQL